MYTYEEALKNSTDYFDGDDLAAKVFIDKYALHNDKGELLEDTPTKMHKRLAKEFARIEKKKFKDPLSEEKIFDLFDKFNYCVPQGSPMYGIGNDYTYQSLGNCFTLGQNPVDSYGGICYADQMLVQLSKRRCVAKGTKVLLKSGLTNIENVSSGDKIYSFNIENRKSEYKAIKNKFKTKVDKDDRIKFTTYSGTILRTSKNHPVLVNSKGNLIYKLSSEIKEGDFLVKAEDEINSLFKNKKISTKDKDCYLRRDQIVKIERDIDSTEYFDIEVEDNANFYAGNFGSVVIHNCGVGLCLDNLRPKGMSTKNAAKTTDGIGVFMERFSNSTREVAQCIAEDQKVLTKEGLIEIKNVQIGQDTWTQKGWKKVINKYHNGPKYCFKLKTKKGFNIECSEDHKFFDEDKNLKTLKEFEIDERITLIPGKYNQDINCVELNTDRYPKNTWGNKSNRLTEIDLPSKLTKDLGYFLGYFYGDGYVNIHKETKRGIGLACSNDYPKIKEKLKNIFRSNFNCDLKSKPGDGDLEDLYCFSTELCYFLENNQLLKQKSAKLIFPKNILKSSQSIQLAFIAGFLDADGTTKNPKKSGISITSTSKKFLEVCQNCLMSCGILSRIADMTCPSRKSHWSPIFRLIISGKYTQELSVELLKDSIKIQNHGKLSVRDLNISAYSSKDFALKPGQISYINYDKFSAGVYKRLKEDGFDIDKELLVLDEIESIESIGTKETYDLTIEDTGMFYCEGFYVKNSGRRGATLIGLSVHHPEIETFINIKRDKTKVTGANISILVTDEFMTAVKKNKDYEQRWPIDSKNPQVKKTVSAKKIWDQIIDAVYDSAEPGLLFLDTAQKWGTSHQYHVLDKRFADRITNPCVTGDTKILIKGKDGQPKNLRIETLVGKKIEVWNGWEWSETEVKITGASQPILKVTTSTGKSLKCTHNHKFKLADGKKVRTSADCLRIGDVLQEGNKYTNSGQIVKIEDAGVADVVYCFTEPKRHYGVFNDILTGQCGEIWMGMDSCRLMLLNLYSYVDNPFTKTAQFNYDLFKEHSQIAQRLMDDMVDLEIEKIEKILKKIKLDPENEKIKAVEYDMWTDFLEVAKQGRRTGLGITGLGDCLAALGIKYGSNKSLKTTEEIYKTLAIESMRSSCKMAEEIGTFPLFSKKIEKEITQLELILSEDDELKRLYNKSGRRNISLTTTAPAGTVSLLTQTTSGIEPAFLLEYKRRRKVPKGSKNIVFVDKTGDCWEEYTVYHHKFKKWKDITGKKEIEDSPYYQACSNDIDWVNNVKLQGLAQKWITHSISKTCNLPNDIDKETISTIYLKAHEAGCKGFTAYRDGCRDGVLLTNNDVTLSNNSDPRPKKLICEVHTPSVQKNKYFVLVGIHKNKPYEVFAGRANFIGDSAKSGVIYKTARPKGYKAVLDDETVLQPLTGFCDENEEALTRLVSTSLRHNVPLEFVIDQLQKTQGDMYTFAKAIARSLKKYVTNGAKSSITCQECGEKLVYSEGCVSCKSCGFSKC